MNRRTLLRAMGPVSSLAIAGCIGSEDLLGPSDRSDLSEYDRQGLRRYEQAYSLAQSGLSKYGDGWQRYLDSIPDGATGLEDYPTGWQRLADKMRSATEDFNDATEQFNTARQLGESPEFNEPCVTAVDWIEAHLAVLDWFNEIGGPGKDLVIQLHNTAKSTASPMPPEALLDRLLDRPPGTYTPLDTGTPVPRPEKN